MVFPDTVARSEQGHGPSGEALRGVLRVMEASLPSVDWALPTLVSGHALREHTLSDVQLAAQPTLGPESAA